MVLVKKSRNGFISWHAKVVTPRRRIIIRSSSSFNLWRFHFRLQTHWIIHSDSWILIRFTQHYNWSLKMDLWTYGVQTMDLNFVDRRLLQTTSLPIINIFYTAMHFTTTFEPCWDKIPTRRLATIIRVHLPPLSCWLLTMPSSCTSWWSSARNARFPFPLSPAA